MSSFCYSMYGFNIESELEIPYLKPVEEGNKSDIIIQSSNESIINDFLFPSYVNSIIRQSGLLAIHGTALCKNGVAIILCSNNDISELVLEFIQNDWKFMADEIVIIEKNDNAYCIRPGIPVIKVLNKYIHKHHLDEYVISIDSTKEEDFSYLNFNHCFYEKNRFIDSVFYIDKSTKELSCSQKSLYFKNYCINDNLNISKDFLNTVRSFSLLYKDPIETYKTISDLSFNFTIKIANNKVLIKPFSDKVKSTFRKYLTSGEYDFEINVNQQNLDSELKIINEYRERNYNDPVLAAERSSIFRALAENLPSFGSFLLHGSAISYNNQGIIFVADSGTGKSTYAYSWYNSYKDKVEYINDDKPFISMSDDSPLIYGSPWNGKHGRGQNTSAPLKAICFIERSLENNIKKINSINALSLLLPHVYIPEDINNKKHLYSLVSKAATKIDFYIVQCNQDTDACISAKEELFKYE